MPRTARLFPDGRSQAVRYVMLCKVNKLRASSYLLLHSTRQREMRFDWDPLKERMNMEKHGLSFSGASLVSTDRNSLSNFDDEHSGNEDRWITLGMLPGGTVVVVAHTFRGKNTDLEEYVRIISARRATKNEIKQYHERLP